MAQASLAYYVIGALVTLLVFSGMFVALNGAMGAIQDTSEWGVQPGEADTPQLEEDYHVAFTLFESMWLWMPAFAIIAMVVIGLVLTRGP